MPLQKVMDRTGHTTHEFDANDVVSLEEANQRFLELTGRGFFAAKKLENGEHEMVRDFNADDEEVLFIPRLQGG